MMENRVTHVYLPSYCDMGYTFYKINKKCIKDVWSSIEIPNKEEEKEKEEETILRSGNNKFRKKKASNLA